MVSILALFVAYANAERNQRAFEAFTSAPNSMSLRTSLSFLSFAA
ncbi:MAG TPA: hypothetical protein VKD71_15090 [Gemmataceae bacterium]|nr:hypothetical protein [Gemmataceae bacterium]